MQWISIAVLLLFTGVALGLGPLVYAMSAFLGVVGLSRFLARSWSESVVAMREVSRTECSVGDRVGVIVTIRNNGRLPIVWLLVEDSLPKSALLSKPPKLRREGRRRGLFLIRGGGQVQLLYQVTFDFRGYYQLGPLLVETGDLFGLHRRYRILTEPAYVLVHPRVLPVYDYDLASRRPIGEVKLTHRLFEDPTRIAGVRRYQQGDPLSRIHWRATARTGELHSKTYEPSSVAGASLVIDFHADNYSPRGEPHRSDLVITAAASLAHLLTTMGEQVGIYTNGRDALDRIHTEGHDLDFATREIAQEAAGKEQTSERLRPVQVTTSRGDGQFEQIRETLARVELTDGLGFPDLLIEVESDLPRDATVVALLADVTEPMAAALGDLRRRGYAVAALVFLYDNEPERTEAVGRLLAQRIDARVISDEQALAELCRQRLVTA